jgi:hypothetical protein
LSFIPQSHTPALRAAVHSTSSINQRTTPNKRVLQGMSHENNSGGAGVHFFTRHTL